MPETAEYKIAVVHLVWLPFGPGLFKAFIDSYVAHPAGYDHELVFLFNGCPEPGLAQEYHAYATTKSIPYRSFYKQGGQDIEAYHWIAPQLQADYLLFLNSYSRLLANDWLKLYIDAIKRPDVGIVAATGSYGSVYSNLRRDFPVRKFQTGQSFASYIRDTKMALKTLWYKRYFRPFPNPHIRTNAFIINRLIWMDIQVGVLKKKIDAYRFESGRQGLTPQIMQKGLKVLLIDRQGQTYGIRDWPKSHTFWIALQENLLVADNQTGIYSSATVIIQQQLTKDAWGIHE